MGDAVVRSGTVPQAVARSPRGETATASPRRVRPTFLRRRDERQELGTRVDLNPAVDPDVVADAHDLPFQDECFDCVILDPPYSDTEARELYATPALRAPVYTREAVRVLRRPGGWLCVYTDREPARPPRCNHTLRIVVVLRPHHRARTCGVFQKRKPGMPYYGTEHGEENGEVEDPQLALALRARGHGWMSF